MEETLGKTSMVQSPVKISRVPSSNTVITEEKKEQPKDADQSSRKGPIRVHHSKLPTQQQKDKTEAQKTAEKQSAKIISE